MASKLSTTAVTNTGGSNGSAYAYGSGDQIALSQIIFYERSTEQNDTQYLPPEPGFDAKYAVDGSVETGWSSVAGMAEQQLTVDMGEETVIDYASLTFGKEKPTSFTIEFSNDNETWTKVADISNNTESNYFIGVDPVTEARYAKLTLSGNADGYTVMAFDLFGPGVAESLSLDQATANMNVDDEMKLTATLLPESLRNKTVIWQSSDPAIATVSAAGVVKAITAGKAVITAKSDADNSLTDSCEVTVAVLPVENVVLDVTEKVLGVGENLQLSAAVVPANATDRRITYSVSDESIATVSDDGFVTALKEGQVTVKAVSVADNTKFAECVILVSDIVSIEADNTNGELTVFFNQLPNDIMKMLFTAFWQSAENDEETEITLENMVIDRDNNTVFFTFDPISGSLPDSVEIVVRYKDGAAVATPISTVAVRTETTFSKGSLVEAAGESLTISAVVTKNSDDGDDTITVVAALYDADGRLSALQTDALDFSDNATQTTDLILDIPTETEDCLVKVFYWNSAMTPVTDAVSFE
jgi:uncharacterized protein YjdB